MRVTGLRRVVVVLAGSLLVAGLALPGSAFGAGDVNVASCPNEALMGFESFLPDCRAYEMVTPSYKQGYPVVVHAIAEDGSRVVGQSLGAFAGAVGGPQVRSELGVEYEFARGSAAGWVATALTPANPRFLDSSSWEATSADLSRTLWSMPSAPVGQDDYYVRGQDGLFSDVGPVTPPADGATVPPASPGSGPSLGAQHFAGASSDLSHVIFDLAGDARWPGDSTPTDFDALYEYVGGGNSAPLMVGVGGGRGSTSLIGECGVDLGGPFSRYNAVSAGGSTVFFTPIGADVHECGRPQPPVDELFARLGESRTVLLSGSSPAGCTTPACQGAPVADALFEGASRDGSKVFFASTQQLVDQAGEDATGGDSAVRENGGGCPQAHEGGCNLYEYDFANPAGGNLVLVSGGSSSPRVQGVVRISQDGSHVYFVAQGELTSTPNGRGQVAQAGAENLYVFERDARFPGGSTRFVAAVSPEDEALWGGEQNLDQRPAQASPDGRFLVFQSHGDLTPDDMSSGVWQVFEYDAQSGVLVRVSHGQGGFNGDGNTSTDSATIPAPYFGAGGYRLHGLALSDDGSYVFFQSALGLTPQAVNDVPVDQLGHKAMNVYEYHAGGVFLVSDGQDITQNGYATGSNVELLGGSASGVDVFFTAGDRLVPGDVDTQRDLYDARVNGGFPTPPVSAGCVGEACQGALGAVPGFAGAGSAVLAGGGNLAPAASSPKPKAAPKRRASRHKHVRSRRRRRAGRRAGTSTGGRS